MRATHISILSVTLCFSLCGGFARAGAADDYKQLVAKGREIAESHCKRCHAIDKMSVSSHKTAPEFRIVVKRYSPWTLAEALAGGIVTDHPDMPPFKFEPPDITALLTCMDTLIEDTNDEQR